LYSFFLFGKRSIGLPERETFQKGFFDYVVFGFPGPFVLSVQSIPDPARENYEVGHFSDVIRFTLLDTRHQG